jgi:hypothetical protein
MSWSFHCPCGYYATSENGLPHEHEPEQGGCCNCGGQRCMGCVFREYDHECQHDCPDCAPTSLPPK